MDRYAIFVDVGYVYAAGGNLILDTENRAQIRVLPEPFIGKVRDIVETAYPNSGDFLRIYWYDAAPKGVAQPEHEAVAAMHGVKVRLGRLTRYGQKGVDALVLRDMMRLSAEHAICTAFLLTGDEDLRQGVIEAQDFGVKVVLLGIEPTLAPNQAESLIQEADELRTLSYDELRDCFRAATGAGVVFEEGFDAYGIGAEVGAEWAERATEDEVGNVATTGRIPGNVHYGVIRRLLDVGDLPPSAQVPEFILAQARDGFAAAVRRSLEFDPQRPAVRATIPVSSTEPAAVRPTEAVADTGPAAKDATVTTPANVPDDQAWAFQEGAAFGLEWLNEQPQEEARFVRGGFPRLPAEIDRPLLRRLVREMGLPQDALIDDADRKAARAGFWQALGMELDLGVRRGTPRFDAILEPDPYVYGQKFARQWADASGASEVERARNLVQKRIGLPSDADAAMLRLAAAQFGDPVPVDVRHRLRAGFGDTIEVL